MRYNLFPHNLMNIMTCKWKAQPLLNTTCYKLPTYCEIRFFFEFLPLAAKRKQRGKLLDFYLVLGKLACWAVASASIFACCVSLQWCFGVVFFSINFEGKEIVKFWNLNGMTGRMEHFMETFKTFFIHFFPVVRWPANQTNCFTLETVWQIPNQPFTWN